MHRKYKLTAVKGPVYFSIGVLLSSIALGADARWIHIPSGDFEVLSSAGEGDTRRTLEYFDAVSGFFTQTMGSAPEKVDPIRIVIFNSKKDYELYRPNDFAEAFYTQRGGRDYIVLGSAAVDAFPVAVHEYVHLVVRHLGFEYPPWLNEGLAELYATMKPIGGQIIVGAPVLGRLQALGREKWVPLASILGAGADSAFYNEKNKAGSLYNEGWALTHMLSLAPAYLPGFSKVQAAIRTGTPSQQAIEQIYGKPLAAIESELQGYVRRGDFRGAVFPLNKTKSGERAAVEAASAFDVKLALAEIGDRPGREAETRKELEELTTENPKRPEPLIDLGYLDGRAGHVDEARKSFAAAIDLGSRNHQMLWDYGRMAMQADPERSIRALSLLIEQRPARMEVRLALAQSQLNGKHPKEALETLQVTKISATDAPTLFSLLAYAHLETGARDAARLDAQRWKQNAKEPDDRDRADQMLKFLEAPGRSSQPPALETTFSSNGDGQPDSRPTLTRTTPNPRTDLTTSPPRPWRAGSFVELDCSKPQPNLILDIGGQRTAFLMDNPAAVRVFGNSSSVELNCGPQKPIAVWIEYDLPAVGSSGAMPLVRAIHYEPPPAGQPVAR